MRRFFLFSFLLLITARPAAAHPGSGIVIDRSGNVFYTDLVHVWRIAHDGSKSIAVRDVHTHELAIDSAGVVYGEDNRYIVGSGDKYRHRIWRRLPNGRVEDVIPWTDGFWRRYGFVRDSSGATYWPYCPERVCRIQRRAADGEVTDIVPAPPVEGMINFLAPAPGGALYFYDRGALAVLNRDGSHRTVARELGSMPFGMHADEKGGVYVAVYGRRAIVHVTAAGKITEVARTPEPWGPSGVVKAANGDLWILEYSTTNEARVRRVAAGGRVTVY